MYWVEALHTLKKTEAVVAASKESELDTVCW